MWPPTGSPARSMVAAFAGYARRTTKLGGKDLKDLFPFSTAERAEQLMLGWGEVLITIGTSRFVVQTEKVIGRDFKFDGNAGHNFGCRVAQAFLITVNLAYAQA